MSKPDFGSMDKKALDECAHDDVPCSACRGIALRLAYDLGAEHEREQVITKLCTEHVHEDDLIAWLRARAKGGA